MGVGEREEGREEGREDRVEGRKSLHVTENTYMYIYAHSSRHSNENRIVLCQRSPGHKRNTCQSTEEVMHTLVMLSLSLNEFDHQCRSLTNCFDDKHG